MCMDSASPSHFWSELDSRKSQAESDTSLSYFLYCLRCFVTRSESSCPYGVVFFCYGLDSVILLPLWLILSNSPTQLDIKLDQTNYCDWKIYVEMFDSFELLGHTEDFGFSDETTPDRDVVDLCARVIVNKSVVTNICSEMHTMRTTQAMWDYLCGSFPAVQSCTNLCYIPSFDQGERTIHVFFHYM